MRRSELGKSREGAIPPLHPPRLRPCSRDSTTDSQRGAWIATPCVRARFLRLLVCSFASFPTSMAKDRESHSGIGVQIPWGLHPLVSQWIRAPDYDQEVGGSSPPERASDRNWQISPRGSRNRALVSDTRDCGFESHRGGHAVSRGGTSLSYGLGSRFDSARRDRLAREDAAKFHSGIVQQEDAGL